jgi:hypothetical protein
LSNANRIRSFAAENGAGAKGEVGEVQGAAKEGGVRAGFGTHSSNHLSQVD